MYASKETMKLCSCTRLSVVIIVLSSRNLFTVYNKNHVSSAIPDFSWRAISKIQEIDWIAVYWAQGYMFCHWITDSKIILRPSEMVNNVSLLHLFIKIFMICTYLWETVCLFATLTIIQTFWSRLSIETLSWRHIQYNYRFHSLLGWYGYG